MKSNISQIVCSVKEDNTLGIILVQHMKNIVKNFNIVLHIDSFTDTNILKILPVNKDGEDQQQIFLKLSNNFEILKSKQRDLYIVLLLAKILYNIDERIYHYYIYVYYKKNQYVNLLMYSLSKLFPMLNDKKDNKEVFTEVINSKLLNVTSLTNLPLTIHIENVELILSDDLYRYIGYKLINEPCVGLKSSYETSSLYGYPLKVSVDSEAVYDYFCIKINHYEVYSTIVMLEMNPAFYLPLHILEPLAYKNYIIDEELKNKGYTLFEYDTFIELVLKRIIEAVNLLNSEEEPLSPMWIRTQFECKNLLNAKMKNGALDVSK